MSENQVDVVKGWLENIFKPWFELNNSWKINNIKEVGEEITFQFELDANEIVNIEISNDEIQELFLINDEIKNKHSIRRLDENILNGVFELEPNKLWTPLLSNYSEITLPLYKKKISFICGHESNLIKVNVDSELSLRILYLIVEEKWNVKFLPKLNEDSTYANDLSAYFPYFTFLNIDFNFYNKSLNDNDKMHILLNVIFCYNLVLQSLILPQGLYSNNGLKYFTTTIMESTEESSNPYKIPFNKYDIESLIYYLVAQNHDDFRFKYLDMYHVLEYYFDRAALYNIKDAIKRELDNPLVYFDDNETFKLAKSLKEIIIVDKTKYKEEHSLFLVLKLITLRKIIQSIGDSTDDEIKLELPSVGNGGNEHLSKIHICFKKDKSKYSLNNNESSEDKILEKLRDRIYNIRNAIAHSKEEFNWRLKPNSIEVNQLELKDLELIRVLSIEIMKYFKVPL